MNALAVLYGGSLAPSAFERVFSGDHALTLALKQAAAFPGVSKTLFLASSSLDPALFPPESSRFKVLKREYWTKKAFLDALADESAGFDLTYFAWADCPLLDPILAGKVADRHIRYAAEYSYADGWPYSLAPEILSPGTAAILAKIAGDAGVPVERDALFSVIQKDINAFDIETEISPVDLRNHRLSLTADSRRNLLLLTRLIQAGLSRAEDAAGIIAAEGGLLRTLPSFYAIQVSGPCPKSC
jgi:spiro-SPASM protein